MAKRKFENKLIHKSEIQEEMMLISGSETDYISPSGHVYKIYDIEKELFFPKKSTKNKVNGYHYVAITYPNIGNISKRLHILVAKAYLNNPNPQLFKIVGNKDDNKDHNSAENLYWTNTRENTQSAVNHGLIHYNKSENNDKSVRVKVMDQNLNIIGVYGSLRECARCIDNLDISYLHKVVYNISYKTRSKKYLYQVASEDEFQSHLHLRSKILHENPKVNKKPKVFYLINDSLKYKKKFDNQTTASKEVRIPQARISKMILEGISINGWRCELIKEIDYTDASSYKNLIDSFDNIQLTNINTGKQIIFDNPKQVRDFVGINGHDINQYIRENNILMNKWKVSKVNTTNIGGYYGRPN